MYTVYVLYSEKFDKIYIGFTSNMDKRIESHNVLARKGWTIKFRPWVLVYSEVYQTKAEALQREKQLKTAKGRAVIWERINSMK
ncbi:MAG: GIY-YIG nuclease family protein [Bacteroidales bacterium]